MRNKELPNSFTLLHRTNKKQEAKMKLLDSPKTMGVFRERGGWVREAGRSVFLAGGCAGALIMGTMSPTHLSKDYAIPSQNSVIL